MIVLFLNIVITTLYLDNEYCFEDVVLYNAMNKKSTLFALMFSESLGR